MDSVYLDNAATTPLTPEVREAMLAFLGEDFGNPSSRHPLGVRAREAVDEARRRLGHALGARPEDVLFTSGGTEANNLGLIGAARQLSGRRRRILIGATEHPCVRASAKALAAEGFQVEQLALDERGELDLEDLDARLSEDVAVVAVMLANNEFGSVYPIRELARRARRKAPGAHVHVDAVQAFGKLDVQLDELECSSLAISGHKVHGPKGIGVLALAEGVRVAPLLHGGGQERELRPGTENVPGIVGLGTAAQLCVEHLDETIEHARQARAILASGLTRIQGARFIEPGARVLDAIASIYVPGVPAEVRMHHLEQRGVYVSAGSACQAAKPDLSPALLASGLSPEEARRVLRISFSRLVPLADVERATQVLVEVSRELEEVAS